MSELMRASRQWASRPAEERFWSIEDLSKHCNSLKTREDECKLGQITARPNGEDISLFGPHGNEFHPTNWGFSQLCRLVKAPHDFLSELPASLACECLNFRLNGHGETVKVFSQQNGGVPLLRAITTPIYTRYYDKQLCQWLEPFQKAGWKVPPARPVDNTMQSRPATENDIIPGMSGGAQIKEGDMISASGVYRGDRSSFIFLASGDKSIDDGNGGGMFKGIIASNSEVGNGSIHFQGFYHQGVCGNHIIWGVSDIVEMSRVHKGNLEPFFRDLRTWLANWSGVDMGATEQMIVAAKAKVLGATDEEVKEKLHKLGLQGLTQKAIAAAFEYAEKWEQTAGASPRTAWGFVHGLTRYSQTMIYVDHRNMLDVAGGKILNLAM